jgi:hypothetical protein
MRWPSAWLAAFSCAVVVAGCGSSSSTPPPKPPPRIPAAVAQKLAADAEAVASAAGCAARGPAAKLQTDLIDSVGRIPSRYQEQLMSAANALVARIPECAPPQPQGHGKAKGHHKKHDKHDEGD